MFRYYSFSNRAEYLFYFLVMVPIFIISIVVTIRLKLIYKKFSKISNKNMVSGAVVARNILDGYGLNHVEVVAISGELSDHYDPVDNVVRLSYKNYEGTSIAAIGVAAHEVGHAVQHAQNYVPVKIRSAVIPVTKLGSMLYFPVFFVGFILSSLKLIYLGIILFSLVTFFEFVTLPVEFNASSRAIKILKSQKILDFEELKGVKKVLWAAAMTYVVSFVASLAQLIRFILMVRTGDDD